MATFERAFSDAERAADATARAATAVVATAKQVAKAARDGDISRLRKRTDQLTAAGNALRQEVENARSAWPFSPEEEEHYLRERYAAELVDLGKAHALSVHNQDQALVAFPSVIRVLPSERAVKINRTKITGLRPSRLVSLLKLAQSKKSRTNSQAFLDTLHAAYRLLIEGAPSGKPVLLTRVYKALTLLPGASNEYSKDDFARDLLLLDRSGLREAKVGAQVTFPASTGTKGSKETFACVAPDGEVVTFYGIAFTEVQS